MRWFRLDDQTILAMPLSLVSEAIDEINEGNSSPDEMGDW